LTKEEKISILISTYNKEKFIKNTINSCLNQNYKNYEIIVVDTGSRDKTKKIIKKFGKKKIKKIFLKKKYSTSPLNQIYSIKNGLKISSGKIICLLDGDDIFKENKLKVINNFFIKNKKVCFVQDIPKIIKNKNKFNYNLKRMVPYLKIWPKFYPTSTFSIRKKNLKKYFAVDKGYNYNLLEIDARLFFYSKIIKKNHSLIKKNLTYYVKDSSGISSRYKRFTYEWFLKRVQAHEFLKNLFKNKSYPYKVDYSLSKKILNFW
tara:strand:- start:1068 stop:1853 length:786 start_codon:yes stop_codon:yes gene_type:complete